MVRRFAFEVSQTLQDLAAAEYRHLAAALGGVENIEEALPPVKRVLFRDDPAGRFRPVRADADGDMWMLIDRRGRVALKVHRPTWSPFADGGDDEDEIAGYVL